MMSLRRAEAPALDGLRALPLAGFLVVAALVALPILAHPYLPLADLPNHIARHHVATTDGGPLARYYAYHLGLAPNSAADRAYLLLGTVMGPLRFSQWAMAAYGVALLASAMWLGRVAWGRWSPWPLAAALVAYNGSFFWGFENYLLSLPMAVAALALWLAIEDRPLPWRLLVMVPVVGLIYLCHFYAFAFLAMAAFGREVQRLVAAGSGRARQLGRGLAMALPFVLPLAWLVSVILTSPPSAAGSFTLAATWGQRLEALQSVAAGPTDRTVLGSVAAALTTAFLSALLMFARNLPGRPRLVLAPRLRGPVIAVGVAAALAPFALNGVAYTHIRLPFVVVVLLIAGSRWEGLSRRAAVALAAVVLALVSLRGLAFERLSALHSAEMRDLSATLESLPPGSRVFPLTENSDRRLWHVQAYAVTERDAFVPTLFQGVHDLQVLPEWLGHSHPQGSPVPLEIALSIAAGNGRAASSDVSWTTVEYVDDWPEKFTHALLVGPSEPSLPQALPSWLRPVSQSGRFSLHEITDPEGARREGP